MGHSVIHIESTGIHDNGRDDDADVMFARFVDDLAKAGHQVHHATFTTGSTRKLLNADDTTPLRHGEAEYRHRAD